MQVNKSSEVGLERGGLLMESGTLPARRGKGPQRAMALNSSRSRGPRRGTRRSTKNYLIILTQRHTVPRARAPTMTFTTHASRRTVLASPLKCSRTPRVAGGSRRIRRFLRARPDSLVRRACRRGRSKAGHAAKQVYPGVAHDWCTCRRRRREDRGETHVFNDGRNLHAAHG